MKVLYCWRCRAEVPMLETPAEVGRVLSRLTAADREGALDEYFAITGVRETNPLALWHHVTSLHGPPCPGCGKPIRTRKATCCVSCGEVFDHPAH